MFTARVTSKFTPLAIQISLSGIFSNAVFMVYISWPIGGHLKVYCQSHLQVYSPLGNQTCISGIFSNAVFMGHISWPIGGHLHVYCQSHLQVYSPSQSNMHLWNIFKCSVHGSHLMANRRTPSSLLPESPPSLLPQAIKHASLEYFQMQCSWFTSHGQ